MSRCADKSYGKNIRCPKCKKLMYCDDIDTHFEGCQDEVLLCDDCSTTAFVKVRYSKVCKIEYRDEDANEIFV